MTVRLATVVAGLGIAAGASLVVALVARWAALIGWALAIFGAEYALFLRLRGGTADSRAPFIAAGLIVVGELAFTAVGGGRGGVERAIVFRAAVRIAGAAGAAAIVAGVVLVAAGSVASGLALEAVAVAAAAAVLATVIRIAARTRESTSSSA